MAVELEVYFCPDLEGPSLKVQGLFGHHALPEMQYSDEFSVANLQLGAGLSPPVCVTEQQTACMWLSISVPTKPACMQPLEMKWLASSYLVFSKNKAFVCLTNFFLSNAYLLFYFCFCLLLCASLLYLLALLLRFHITKAIKIDKNKVENFRPQ